MDDAKAAERPKTGGSIVLGRYGGEGLWVGDWYVLVTRVRRGTARIGVAGPALGTARAYQHPAEYRQGDGFTLSTRPHVTVEVGRVKGHACRLRVTGPVKVTRDEWFEEQAQAAARTAAFAMAK